MHTLQLLCPVYNIFKVVFASPSVLPDYEIFSPSLIWCISGWGYVCVEYYGNQSQGDQEHVTHIRLPEYRQETIQSAQNSIYLLPDCRDFWDCPWAGCAFIVLVSLTTELLAATIGPVYNVCLVTNTLSIVNFLGVRFFFLFPVVGETNCISIKRDI